MKRYIVTSTQTQHGPIYQIEDKVTGAVLEADWWSEKWAQRRADWMNYKEMERNGESIHHGIPERASRVSVGNKDTAHKTKNP